MSRRTLRPARFAAGAALAVCLAGSWPGSAQAADSAVPVSFTVGDAVTASVLAPMDLDSDADGAPDSTAYRLAPTVFGTGATLRPAPATAAPRARAIASTTATAEQRLALARSLRLGAGLTPDQTAAAVADAAQLAIWHQTGPVAPTSDPYARLADQALAERLGAVTLGAYDALLQLPLPSAAPTPAAGRPGSVTELVASGGSGTATRLVLVRTVAAPAPTTPAPAPSTTAAQPSDPGTTATSPAPEQPAPSSTPQDTGSPSASASPEPPSPSAPAPTSSSEEPSPEASAAPSPMRMLTVRAAALAPLSGSASTVAAGALMAAAPAAQQPAAAKAAAPKAAAPEAAAAKAAAPKAAAPKAVAPKATAPKAALPADDSLHSSCTALGRTDVTKSDADYRAALDTDGDGIACESNGGDGKVTTGTAAKPPAGITGGGSGNPPATTPQTTTSANDTGPVNVTTTSGGLTSSAGMSCSDLKAKGQSDLTTASPLYRTALDRDNDGIACETNGNDEGTSTTTTLTAPMTQALAYTGSEADRLGILGGGLVATGLALVLTVRHRRG